MAASIGSSDDLGSVNDAVEITLGGSAVLKLETYEVRQSFFQQPASFSFRIGDGTTAKALMALAPPNQDFELHVGGKTQFVGKTDGYSVDANGTGGTNLTIRGRDNLAPLHDACVLADTSFTSSDFTDLTNKVLAAAGVSGFSLFTDNSANRSRKAGVAVKQTGVPDYIADVLTSVAGKASIQAKAGERWLHYLLKEYNLAGLFLFAGVDGTFILTAPNGKQQPTYRLVRQAGALRNVVNVESVRYKNETTTRYSECRVLMRGGSMSATSPTLVAGGRTQSSGIYVDQEMVALGYNRPLVVKSKRCQSANDATFLARKRIANANRANNELVYVVSGHTIPSLFGGARAVWTVDTVVDVQDDELGIQAPYWIEQVTFRSAPTTTEVVLQRPQDLIYGGGED